MCSLSALSISSYWDRKHYRSMNKSYLNNQILCFIVETHLWGECGYFRRNSCICQFGSQQGTWTHVFFLRLIIIKLPLVAIRLEFCWNFNVFKISLAIFQSIFRVKIYNMLWWEDPIPLQLIFTKETAPQFFHWITLE